MRVEEQETVATTLPLLRGREGFPAKPVDRNTPVGMLMVAGEPRGREGLTVQRCLCGCSQPSCVEEADVDVRYLHDEANFTTAACILQGRPFFPPFDELRRASARRKVGNTEQYRQAYVRGYLPRGAPMDPAEYDEWTSWGGFTGNGDYQSDRELFDGLLALDLNSLGLLPKPERRRVLLLSRHWGGIKGKAAQLGIPEPQIPDRMGEIVSALNAAAPDRPRKGAGESKSAVAGAAGGGYGSKLPQKLTLSSAPYLCRCRLAGSPLHTARP